MSAIAPRGYPLGVPFRPPDDRLARRAAQLRRWTYVLLGGGAIVLVLAVAAGVVLLHFWNERASRSRVDSPRTGSNEGKHYAGEAGQDDRNLRAASQPLDPDRKGKADPPGSQAESASAKPAASAQATTSRAERELFLQTIAVLTVGHLYQSYMTMGLLADGMEKETLQKAAAAPMLTEVRNTLNVVDRQLARLAASRLETADQQDVAQVRKVSELLRQQAGDLQAYWENPTAERRTQYQRSRAKAWGRIKPLLGIDD